MSSRRTFIEQSEADLAILSALRRGLDASWYQIDQARRSINETRHFLAQLEVPDHLWSPEQIVVLEPART